ncbi:unnamed protein product [Rhizoctonia solani]|uniref:Uncharacterized protein n=2 Tax=Rhizoctonia solani TaxID=456999 RepID=A0A8H3B1L4_9AGAM|nr:unnamed protein product [Rhizoctonia solani]
MNTRKFKRRKDNNKYRDKILQARHLIYDKGQSVQSKGVEDLLKDSSYVPVMNTFSFQLGDLGFNSFGSLVIDQLHEVELGVWKALFKHLIRLLHLSGNSAVVEFNRRFRSVPSFSSTIRLFAEDVSELGCIAARDYEDILQCCMPVFEGLLPASCEIPAQKLLFVFATWHGLSKLRLHTRDTLQSFKSITTQLGNALREFADLTKDLEVRETPKEYARRRKQIEAGKASVMARRARHSKKPPTLSANNLPVNPNNLGSDGRRLCKLNLDTYKAHSLADYPWTVEEYGTTDSYSTQINELQNRKIKGQYARTNHRNIVEQMTRVGDITAVLEDIDTQLKWVRNKVTESTPLETNAGAVDSLLDGAAYSIGLKERSEDAIRGIPQWVASHQDDDATKFFIPQLKRHLLTRILGAQNRPNFDDSELINLRFYQEQMWRHKTLGINYTSYDILRQQDPLNPSTSNRFIVLASSPTNNSESPNHPFIYAKILGIYHAKVIYKGQRPERMDFVHVRWLYYDYDHPDDIVRACHLIPDFNRGTVADLLSGNRSLAHDDPDFGDWSRYYVGRFVDRDMLMRHLGGGIGHYKPKPSENSQSQVVESNDRAIDPGSDEDDTTEGDKDGQVDHEPVHESREEYCGDDIDSGEDDAELDVDIGDDLRDDEASDEDEAEAEATDEEWDDLWGF